MFHPAQWPHWLQMVLIVGHGLLGFFMTWLWWPKTDKQLKRFGILAAYLLLAYYFVLRTFSV